MGDNRGKNQHGNKNPCWKGGKSLSSKGYILVRAPEHPRASTNGYVFEHIIILESKLGRPLLPWECSHHKNEIKTDNRPENLEVKIRGKHTILHWLGKHHSLESIQKMKAAHTGRMGMRGENSPTHKLNIEDIRFIREARGFVSTRDLALRFHVAHQTVSKIQLRRSWQNV